MKNRYINKIALAALVTTGFTPAMAVLDTTQNGVSATHIQDDFMKTEPYESLDNSDKWVNWYSEDTTVYKLVREGDGYLDINCTASSPAFTRIMLAFGEDSNNNPLTIDLSQNAMISLDIENTHADSSVYFTVGLIDIDDNTIEVHADTMQSIMWNGKVHSNIQNLLPGASQTFEFDLTGGYALNAAVSDGWPCTNGTADCPLLKVGDLSQIRAIAFNINPGAGMAHTNKGAFTGTIKLSNLQIGSGELQNDTMSVQEFSSFGGQVSIYPNPVAHAAQIGMEIKHPMNTVIRVVNTLGQTVLTVHDGWLAKGYHQMELQRKDLTEGVYFLQISNQMETLTKKIILK